jgi:hypothetical protein
MSEIDFHKSDRIYNIQVVSSGLVIRSVGFTLDFILSLFTIERTDMIAVDMGPKGRKTKYAIRTNKAVSPELQAKIDRVLNTQGDDKNVTQ